MPVCLCLCSLLAQFSMKTGNSRTLSLLSSSQNLSTCQQLTHYHDFVQQQKLSIRLLSLWQCSELFNFNLLLGLCTGQNNQDMTQPISLCFCCLLYESHTGVMGSQSWSNSERAVSVKPTKWKDETSLWGFAKVQRTTWRFKSSLQPQATCSN